MNKIESDTSHDASEPVEIPEEEKVLCIQREKELQEWNDRYDTAAQKFCEKGLLGVTSDDHWAMGGSPGYRLDSNEGKTLGEIMSDEELVERVDRMSELLQEARAKLKINTTDVSAERDRKEYSSKLSATIAYLDSIGRLPEKYKNSDI